MLLCDFDPVLAANDELSASVEIDKKNSIACSFAGMSVFRSVKR